MTARAHPPRTLGWLLLMLVTAASCRDAAEARERGSRATQADGVTTGVSTEGARHVRTIIGFHDPESALYDPDQDVIFVSNIMGFGSNKDHSAFITRLAAATLDDAVVFAAAGRNGVVLHAPKGMALQGDTLWVTDIDVVRGFHRRTGQPVATIDFTAHRPVQLNDIALGADGTLRVTDTGIYMVYEGNIPVGGDRVFSVGPGHAITTVVQGAHLLQPNGITWDATANRWIVLAFNRFAGHVAAMPARLDSSRTILRQGSGLLDGVEVLRNGSVMFSSWADSSIHVLADGRDVRVIRNVPEPADIGLDTRRGRVLIPLTVLGQLQVWELGRWD